VLSLHRFEIVENASHLAAAGALDTLTQIVSLIVFLTIEGEKGWLRRKPHHTA
jgi:hypothetical protein